MYQLVGAILLGSAQTSAVAGVGTDNLAAVFAATCFDGSARLSAGEVTKIGFADLPHSLRRRLGQPVSSDVWRLNAPGRAYLYVLSYAPGRGANPKICGLASDQMDLPAASDMIDMRLAGSVYPGKSRTTQWMRPEDGYLASATTAGKFGVVQVNWLSDEDRIQALKQLQPISR